MPRPPRYARDCLFSQVSVLKREQGDWVGFQSTSLTELRVLIASSGEGRAQPVQHSLIKTLTCVWLEVIRIEWWAWYNMQMSK